MAEDAEAPAQERLPRGSEPVGHQRDTLAVLTQAEIRTHLGIRVEDIGPGLVAQQGVGLG